MPVSTKDLSSARVAEQLHDLAGTLVAVFDNTCGNLVQLIAEEPGAHHDH